jgi:putative ABC transport system permease protein
MRILDLLNLIFYNLNRRKGRVVLTAVGVVIGTAAIVILVSLANGLQKSATRNLGGISDLTLINVQPKYEEFGPERGMGGGISAMPATQKMLTDETLREIKALPDVKAVIPRDNARGMAIITYGRLENYPMLYSVGIPDVEALGYQMRSGTSKLEKGTVLVGEMVLRQFNDPKARYGQEPPEPPDLLDKQIKITLVKWTNDGMEVRKTYTVRVAGIIKESRNEQDYSVITHIDDLKIWNEWVIGKRINRARDGYDNLFVKVESVDNVQAVSDAISGLGYMAFTPLSFVQGISNFYTIIQIIFGGVGAVALLVAAIGIANTMAMAILERTREIGLMKAIGATNRNVLSIFLGEAAGIGFVGGVGGVALGLLAGEAINIIAMPYLASQAAQMGGPPPEAAVFTPAWLPMFAILFATIIGLLSGLYPALRAATMIPVVALKYE